VPHFPKPFWKKSHQSWYVEIDRKQVKLGPDRDAAFRRYHELMRQPAEKVVAPESVVAIADAFLDWVQKHRSPDTYVWYAERLQRFCRRYPNLSTLQLKPYHVQQWVDSYPGLSTTTRRNYLRSVKRCLKWAVQQGYIPASPIENLPVPGGERKESFVTPAEFELLLSMIQDEDFRDLVVTTWESGCRPQESLRVEARHIDLRHQRWVFPKSESKGKRQPRVVYLTETAAAITRKRMEMYPSGPIFRNRSGIAWTPDAANCAFDRVRTRIFQRTYPDAERLTEERIGTIRPSLDETRVIAGKTVTRSRKQLDAEARRKALGELVKTHIPRCSLYALRHSWATLALQRDVDPLSVATLMGHTDGSTLVRTYSHVSLNPAYMLEQAKRAAGERR